MYSENNEISVKQEFWLVLCEKIGISLLVVPFISIWCYSAVVVKGGALMGFVSGVLVSVLIFAICIGLGRVTDKISFDNKYIKIFECVKMIAIFVAVMVIYSDLAKTLFLDKTSPLLIIAMTAALVFYLASGNIENIARGTEVLSGFIIIPVVIMIISSIPLVDLNLITSGIKGVQFAGFKEVILNIALAFLCITPIGIDKHEQKCKRRASEKALLVIVLLTIVVYVLVLMVVGVGGLRGEEYPLISLMKVSSIPGSFEGDVQGVAALSLFIVISLIYELTDAFFLIRCSLDNKRVNFAAIIALVIVSAVLAKKNINVFEGFFDGFKHYQIEDRQYCMSIAVDLSDEGVIYTYEYRAVDGTLSTTALADKEQDFTRICAIVISQEVKNNEKALRAVAQSIKKNDQIGNNTLVLFCEGEAHTRIEPPNKDEEEFGDSMGEYIAGALRRQNYKYDVSKFLAQEGQ